MTSPFLVTRMCSTIIGCALFAGTLSAQGRPLKINGRPAVLEIRPAASHAVRVTLKALDLPSNLHGVPVLAEVSDPGSVIRIVELVESEQAVCGSLTVRVLDAPLRVVVERKGGSAVQTLTFANDGTIGFVLEGQPVLGMGEGGPLIPKGTDWRTQPVEFDRRGRLDPMQPQWQSQMYGSRNPVALLAGTAGWGLFFHTPWGKMDLTRPDRGRFIPIPPVDPAAPKQTVGNQQSQLGKGLPASNPRDVLDVYIFDSLQPAWLMKDLAAIGGAAAMPPKWALGYMQSHRTLETDKEMIDEVDTFRSKRIPIDGVIYLGTGFTPRGWNKQQPSFEFNPEVFKRDPASVIEDLHERHVKVILHMVPGDRDRLPTLQGSIPPQKGEVVDASHIASYWAQHKNLVETGVDGWWPDEGDWFDLEERMKRHQLYYEGPLSTQPEKRPWSLHRNGYFGIARWGGWVWSGDTESSWKTLEAQIAVGINHSLSIGPYWGSDIGGFYSNHELTGELYARWFQFAAFCPSFRGHGRTWWTRLPWGWSLKKHGPIEDTEPPLISELDHPEVEVVARRYSELRYRLLSYNYTLAWEARETGMPFMRALWLHHPSEPELRGVGDEFLWGRDMLIAPVYQKGAVERRLLLPKGQWHDFWTGEVLEGGRSIVKPVDLATMPIYVRSGAILPLDPVRQYITEVKADPLVIRIYRGAAGSYSLYEDDGESMRYLQGDYQLTSFQWDDAANALSIRDISPKPVIRPSRKWKIEIVPGGASKEITFDGPPMRVAF